MSGKPAGRDVEVLAEMIRPSLTGGRHPSGADEIADTILTSGWYAERITQARRDERERLARCLRGEAHGANGAAFNRALIFAAGCVLAEYDQRDAHSFCLNRETCPRCTALRGDA